MASTNKTPQLGLNQWAAGDSVLREDFNADNAKIEALSLRGWSDELMVVTTTTDKASIDVDVSGLSWSSYRDMEIEVDGASDINDGFCLRVNGKSGSSDYYYSKNTYTEPAFASYISSGLLAKESHLGGSRITIPCSGLLSVFTQQWGGYRGRITIGYTATNMPVNQVRLLSFFVHQGTIKAGATIRICGVRK